MKTATNSTPGATSAKPNSLPDTSEVDLYPYQSLMKVFLSEKVKKEIVFRAV